MIDIKTFDVATEGRTDIINITRIIDEMVKSSKIKSGLVNVFVAGSTAGVTTIEYEPNLIKDVKNVLERIAPENADYEHHKTWGDDNGSSHVRSTLIKPSMVIPFKDKNLLLGTWQQVVLIDFDTKPRKREIVLTIIGE
ncbi:MAG: YjbQ family protein [Candidatus Aenigmarchaeota archaeon]|nr:YjbQ family protein [Candidatus Aenigmarchaeota archaeon]